MEKANGWQRALKLGLGLLPHQLVRRFLFWSHCEQEDQAADHLVCVSGTGGRASKTAKMNSWQKASHDDVDVGLRHLGE